jgi:ubiquinone/menaquinone biosynthesis C-methylase UbiE
MERKEYIKKIYHKHWISVRDGEDIISIYDDQLCKLVEVNVSKSACLFEVGIGNGKPIADTLQKSGFEMAGIDLSPDMIRECNSNNPDIRAKVGDAEKLDYPDDSFDCVYCFHSTWYFPDLNAAISEMIRVTKPGGRIFFDIQNRNNDSIEKAYRWNLAASKLYRRIYRFVKNCFKIVFKVGTPVWEYAVIAVPTYPEEVYGYLDKNESNYNVWIRQENDSLTLTDQKKSFPVFPRIIFDITK